MSITLGVIGGSNFYDFEGLTDRREVNVNTPFGPTPDPIVKGYLGKMPALFVSRHGRGHRFLPHEVPYQAIIFALKMLGADKVIGVSAVGSLRKNIHPGDLVVVSDYVDATWGRPSTFFGKGLAGHIAFADPVCQNLSHIITQAAAGLGITCHPKATLKIMQGPAFSTLAESTANRAAGCDLIGMTSLPEAKLAREAELCYVTLALVTDYDCWHFSSEKVTAEMVVSQLAKNVKKAEAVIREIAARLLQKERTACPCSTALNSAVVTDRGLIPEAFGTGPMEVIFKRVLTKT